ncbi:hypothetical protein D3C80_798490 [compost metagenome]
MRKTILTTIVLITMLSACGSRTPKNAETADSIMTSEDTAFTDSAAVTAENPAVQSNLAYLKNEVGKIPYEAKLFDNEVLTTRLKALLGIEYDVMVKNWNVETPITSENEIIHTSGCKKHDCPGDAYDLYIDLKNDNINVYNMRGSKLILYKEKEEIALSGEMAKELNIKKENAGIK